LHTARRYFVRDEINFYADHCTEFSAISFGPPVAGRFIGSCRSQASIPLPVIKAGPADLAEIHAILFSAREAIGLNPTLFSAERRPAVDDWYRGKLDHGLLWIARQNGTLAGVLILEQDLLCRVIGISYIAVAEHMRGRGEIGPRLVQHAQALASGGFLTAEARNDHSRRLLERCGFHAEGKFSASGHPILAWSRGA
jgi:ribosomal protein S18 acetylase RimI-like enzyme